MFKSLGFRKNHHLQTLHLLTPKMNYSQVVHRGMVLVVPLNQHQKLNRKDLIEMNLYSEEVLDSAALAVEAVSEASVPLESELASIALHC